MRTRLCSNPLPCLLLLLGLGILTSLGVWQLQRAAEKSEILQSYESQKKSPPVALDVSLDDFSHLRYRAVEAYGVYDAEKQFLLDNQIRNGQAGFSVLTPLRLSGGSNKAVLVDRGWIPLGLTRQLLPDVIIEQKNARISGSLYVPFGKAFSLGDMDAGGIGWPRVIQYMAFSEISERLGYDLLPVIIRLSPDAPDGYLREWAPLPFTPARHIAYAVQWFGLALALLIIAVVAMLKQQKNEDD